MTMDLGPLADLPDWYWNVAYESSRVPGVPRGELAQGANCQLWAYAATNDPYGAHVGLWTGDAVAHLCREVGRPTVWPPAAFAARPRYAVRIGIKRPVVRGLRVARGPFGASVRPRSR